MFSHSKFIYIKNGNLCDDCIVLKSNGLCQMIHTPQDGKIHMSEAELIFNRRQQT